MPDHDEIVRLYGPWAPRTPQDAAALLEGYDGPWWIAGGWAVEAFTGVPRAHDDVDPSIPRSDVAALRRHLAGRSTSGRRTTARLRPAGGGDATEVAPTCENLWLRRSGADPWEYDVILMSTSPTTWTFKRDPRISLPLREILWDSDGITYLRPEVQLLHKAQSGQAEGPGRLRGVRAPARPDAPGVAPGLAEHGPPGPPVAGRALNRRPA